MAGRREIEIKFRVKSVRALRQRLRALGFHEQTPRTHEMNTLYDLFGAPLRRRGELLRLRQYGTGWTLTHKAKGPTGRHKTRAEVETAVNDGESLDAILRKLGFQPSFRYEKFRAEWSDGRGHVVIDETPIGVFAEIEGAPSWIDRTARKLHVIPADYMNRSYAEVFQEWKQQSGSRAQEMTFRAIGTLRKNKSGS